MRKSSRQVVFINTSPPEDRIQLLKPLQEIDDLEDDSDEIYASGLIKRYTKRPVKLRGAGISIIGGGGGQIFIYSCSAQLLSFEIECFYSV